MGLRWGKVKGRRYASQYRGLLRKGKSAHWVRRTVGEILKGLGSVCTGNCNLLLMQDSGVEKGKQEKIKRKEEKRMRTKEVV